MNIETLLDVLDSTNVNITTHDNDAIYIAKPDPNSEWYKPDPWNAVYNTLVENEVTFTTSVYNHEDIFKIDDELFIVIYEEED